MKKFVAGVVSVSFCVSMAHGQALSSGAMSSAGRLLNSTLGDSYSQFSQSQYRYTPLPASGMIPVLVLGAVRKPGIHYIPENINLLEVIALAGGATDNAQTEKITISTPDSETRDSYKVITTLDLRKFLLGTTELKVLPKLRINDVLFVPDYQPVIDRDVSVVTTFVGAIASILLSVIIIKREFAQ